MFSVPKQVLKKKKEVPPPPCPACESNNDVVPIVYGLPKKGLAEKAKRGEVVLGGCIHEWDSPTWICKDCRHAWRPPSIFQDPAGQSMEEHLPDESPLDKLYRMILSDMKLRILTLLHNCTDDDFTKLRLANPSTSSYNPYHSYTGTFLELASDIHNENFKKTHEVICRLLQESYLHVETHRVAESVYQSFDDIRVNIHSNFSIGLIKAILDTGNGKSYETAFKVISIDEEYEILRFYHLQPFCKTLRMYQGKMFDVFELHDAETNTLAEIYFNVDIPFTWLKNHLKKFEGIYHDGKTILASGTIKPGTLTILNRDSHIVCKQEGFTEVGLKRVNPRLDKVIRDAIENGWVVNMSPRHGLPYILVPETFSKTGYLCEHVHECRHNDYCDEIQQYAASISYGGSSPWDNFA